MSWWRGLSAAQALALIVVVRLASVFLVKTWYVPDEYWQSLEVAHRFAFGYGELTWEWARGIRSYVHPTAIALLYKVLLYTGLDHAELVILAPRIFQALLSALSDYAVYKWCGQRRWALFLILTQWFWFYTASRTLANTLETVLFGLALAIFPFKDGKKSFYAREDNRWLWFAAVSCHLRPTSVLLWTPLAIYNLWTTNQPRLRLFLYRYIPISVIALSVQTAVDSYFHGALVFTPWEFFKANILNGVGSFYGKHPSYWYITNGLPAVLGVHLVPVLWAVVGILRRPRENPAKLFLLALIVFQVAALSFVPHKEFRFLLPLLPIFIYLSQDVLVQWSRKAKGWQIWTVVFLLACGNIAPAAYFSTWHQRATLEVMPLLRDIAAREPNASITFLLPCHSTPLYSHLHVNITTRYLHCEPPAESIGEVDEAELFQQSPTRWWDKHKAAPSHLVVFDVTLPRLQSRLRDYRVLHELPHTQFPEGYVSEKLVVLERVARDTKPSAPPEEAL